MSDATAQAVMQVPIALLGTVLSTAGGATSALSAARVLGRNVPLVLLLAMIGALFWPIKQEDVPGVQTSTCRDGQTDWMTCRA